MRKPHKFKAPFAAALVGGLWILASLGSYALGQQMMEEDRLKLSEDLAAGAMKRAQDAKEACDAGLIREALGMAREAAHVVSGVAAAAHKANDLKLAQSAQKKVHTISEALKQITEACRSCCMGSDPEKEGARYCCDCDLIKASLRLSRNLMSMTLEAAARAKESNQAEPGRIACSTVNVIAGVVAEISAAGACCAPGDANQQGGGCCCDCEVLGEAVKLARDVSFLILQEADAARRPEDQDLIRSAYRAAGTVAGALRYMTEAWMPWMYCTQRLSSSEAWSCFCDCRLVEDTMTVSENLDSLVSKAEALAKEEKNSELAQDAYNLADAFEKALGGISNVAAYCIGTSMEPASVNCCREVLKAGEEMTKRNKDMIEKLIKLGAVPEGPVQKIGSEAPLPPVRDEIPIRDHEQPPFSPVE